MAAVSLEAFHAAAAHSGDLRTIEAFFAQPHIVAEVQRVNTYFRGRAPSINIFGDGPADPWYFAFLQQPPDPWGRAPRSQERSFIFTTAIARGLNHVVEWFYAPARVALLGDTLAALLPFTGALAADENQLDVVETLVSSEVFVTRVDDNAQQQVLNEMLSVAVERSHPTMMELLVAHGALVNEASEHGRDHPLASCASTGNQDSVAALVHNGAFVVGASLLIHASYLGNNESASALLHHGVDWGNDSGDFNPLHAAAEEGHDDLVRLYLAEGLSDVDAQNSRGETALMMVAWQSSAERGAVCADTAESVTHILLSHNASFSIRDHAGSTALHHAVGTEFTAVVSLLLEAGAEPNQRNERGEAALDRLTELDMDDNDDEFVGAQLELLVDHGADLLALGPDGVSPLHRLRQTDAGLALLPSLVASDGARRPESRRHSV